MENDNFEPYIVGFFCNWCTYTGSDQAGRSRMQRPANVRIIRLMCSGRMDPDYALKALKQGADGVIIGACHLGDCHYVEGNFKTVRRFALIQKFIEQYGINPKRVQLWHISASEGAEFTERIKEYVHELKALGPNPLKEVARLNHMEEIQA
ncbi:F420-non-reducing hydrogenase vhc iron-sulfur subunit D [Candidatus Lokiarchaeum ossiferum]|uniref:F420-non-reducing hydrogenase vhc iron-sulfur subunit D n=1 Tax=Candidatus Lokiarchaeum ossiferum TaxID=2951803 RepID=A0ABY6HQH3_9ARCH|nr:F420-non-reducing hydrogenase vhc iron-sulfur subunit D [Candidatus Lokiarchaeum sp. B-35]